MEPAPPASGVLDAKRPRQVALTRHPLVYGLATGLVVMGAALVGVLVLNKSPSTGPPALRIGAPAPDFSLPRLGGGPPVSLASLRGRPVALNFFASWCVDCQRDLGALAAVGRAAPGGLEVVGVDAGDSAPAEAKAMLARAGARYPVAVDSADAANASFKVTVLPTTVFLDRNGRVAGETFGVETAADLRHWAQVLDAPG